MPLISLQYKNNDFLTKGPKTDKKAALHTLDGEATTNLQICIEYTKTVMSC